MKSSKTFNNISPELLKQIPKLKPNQTVVFRMLNGVPNNDPDEKERQKDPMLYPKVQLLTQYRVYDKFIKDADSGEVVGGYVDCGCVESWKGEQPQSFRCFVTGSNPNNPTAAMPSRFQGKFELKGGNVRDEELYEILWLSPQRKGSPCADGEQEILFEILDTKADSQSSINKVERLRKALKIADEISEEKARAIFAALNQPTYQDKQTLMAKIGEFARDKYEDFLTAYDAKDTDDKMTIKTALDSGLLNHDISTGIVTVGKVKIADLKIGATDEFVNEFYNFVSTATNGKDILANIEKQLKATAKS
jgi:hypothetical protein